jgi:hypothetical protein
MAGDVVDQSVAGGIIEHVVDHGVGLAVVVAAYSEYAARTMSRSVAHAARSA